MPPLSVNLSQIGGEFRLDNPGHPLKGENWTTPDVRHLCALRAAFAEGKDVAATILWKSGFRVVRVLGDRRQPCGVDLAWPLFGEPAWTARVSWGSNDFTFAEAARPFVEVSGKYGETTEEARAAEETRVLPILAAVFDRCDLFGVMVEAFVNDKSEPIGDPACAERALRKLRESQGKL
jgi:hypothetical protein